MFPNTHYKPTPVRQDQIVSAVSSDVPVELGLPVARISPWLVAMLRAAVPEAAVNEHGHAASREHDVGSARSVRQGSSVLPKAEATSMKFGPYPATLRPSAHTDTTKSAVESPR